MGGDPDAVALRPALDRACALGDRAGRPEGGGAEHLGQHLRVQVERVEVLPPEDVDEWGRLDRAEDVLHGGGFTAGTCTSAHANAERAEIEGERGGRAPLGIEEETSRVTVCVETKGSEWVIDGVIETACSSIKTLL